MVLVCSYGRSREASHLVRSWTDDVRTRTIGCGARSHFWLKFAPRAMEVRLPQRAQQDGGVVFNCSGCSGCSCVTGGVGRWLALLTLVVAVPACGSHGAGPTSPDISTLSMSVDPIPLSAQRQADGTWSVPWKIVIQDAGRVGFRVQSWHEE